MSKKRKSSSPSDSKSEEKGLWQIKYEDAKEVIAHLCSILGDHHVDDSGHRIELLGHCSICYLKSGKCHCCNECANEKCTCAKETLPLRTYQMCDRKYFGDPVTKQRYKLWSTIEAVDELDAMKDVIEWGAWVTAENNDIGNTYAVLDVSKTSSFEEMLKSKGFSLV